MNRLPGVLCVCALLSACSGPPAPLDAISAHRGDWVLVNYWAEWCKPCIREVPELNLLDGLDGITVLGVNYDALTGEALDTRIESLGIDFTTIHPDPATALGIARPQVLPTTLVISPEGVLLDTLVGPQTVDSLRAVTLDRR